MSQAAAAERYPVPPDDLCWRATGERDAEAFLRSGRASVDLLEKEALARDGKSLKNFETILDFGCGCGRLTRWLRPLSDPWATIQGVDIDPAAIAWCKQNIGDASFTLAGELPPLRFTDHSIGLILASSVFTHLDADRQFRWLAELQRILKPGGYLVVTFRYRRGIALIADDAVRERVLADIARDGIAFVTTYAWEGVFPSWYGEAYHTPEYIRKHWSSYFELRHIIAGEREETAVLRARESTFLQRLFQRP